MSVPWIAAFIVLSAVVVLLGLILVGTLRRISIVLEQAEERLRTGWPGIGGLAAGAAAPEFEATAADGSTFTAADLDSSAAILLFLSGGCEPCRKLAEELAKESDPDLGAQLFVILNDRREAADLGLPASVEVLYQDGRAVSEAFQIAGTPHAFVIANGRVLAGGVPNSLLSLRELLNRIRKEVRTGTESTQTQSEREIATPEGGRE